MCIRDSGYVVVPDEAADAEELIRGIEISNRTLGFVNAPSLIQKLSLIHI